MKKILTALFVLIAFMVNAQTQRDTFEIQTLSKFSNFEFDSECSDTVLVTTIKGNQIKSYYVLKNNVSRKIRVLTQGKPGLDYAISGSYNDYVLTIDQLLNGRPIRFITIFRSYETNKIVVIEIEDNK